MERTKHECQQFFSLERSNCATQLDGLIRMPRQSLGTVPTSAIQGAVNGRCYDDTVHLSYVLLTLFRASNMQP